MRWILLPSGTQLRHIGRSVFEHLRLRFPHGEEARQYNVLQKLTYLTVLFGLLPLVALTGLTMSPGMDAAVPFLAELFGGRQSARSLHFILAMALLAFFVVHIVMVVLAGPVNELRSMITGRFVIEKENGDDPEST
jgi:thiosulfate reductase cytochrome b subunit